MLKTLCSNRARSLTWTSYQQSDNESIIDLNCLSRTEPNSFQEKYNFVYNWKLRRSTKWGGWNDPKLHSGWLTVFFINWSLIVDFNLIFFIYWRGITEFRIFFLAVLNFKRISGFRHWRKGCFVYRNANCLRDKKRYHFFCFVVTDPKWKFRNFDCNYFFKNQSEIILFKFSIAFVRLFILFLNIC